ncbi:MAG: DUF4410 domain-containing protein [Candidatus Rokubacteria bacterium]|nr:DUF4410 domain-containing protein [Candidatus Rokubacteria bacterium]
MTIARRRLTVTVLLPFLALAAAGCGSTVREAAVVDMAAVQGGGAQIHLASVTAANEKVPSHVVEMVKSFVEQELRGQGLTQERARQLALRVAVKEYRDRGGVVRFMFGVLAGSDHLESVVELTDPRTDRTVARSVIRSYNATAVSSMEGVARRHGEEIVKYIKGVVEPGKP